MPPEPLGLLSAIGPDPDLPVRHCLPELLDALATAGTAVLVAPPGTGKTTLVPLALASGTGSGSRGGSAAGRVVVAEPRRVAARAAAMRMAALLGERLGGRVGLTVRGERTVSAATRVEVVTTGVLVQRLHRDPELPGTDVVLLDECHERHLDADLALALLVDVRAGLRPDLRLVAASATVDAAPFAAALGGPSTPAPVVSGSGRLHPVDVVWCPPSGPVDPPHGLRVDPRFLDHVARTVGRALVERPGDVLVFLPGVSEIAAVERRLGGVVPRDVEVLTLHGRQGADRQQVVLGPGSRRRVVLATAVAESSLTVPGVRVVVDAGLSREPRLDLARGLGSLVTVRVSRAGAEQRAGRAGRQGPGAVYRCWSAGDHDRLPDRPRPEIACADLTGFALGLACWGVPDGAGLALMDQPPASAVEVARSTLRWLGAVGPDGRVTPRGRAMATAGTHPRLARALVDGSRLVGPDRATQVVALLSEDGLAGTRDDLPEVLRALRNGADSRSARWRDEVRRLRSGQRTGTRIGRPTDAPGDPAAGRPEDLPDDLAAAVVVALAFPERLARTRRPGSSTYLMANGTAAELSPSSSLTGTPWLAVAVADRQPGRAAARIRLAVPVDVATAREVAGELVTTVEEVGWQDGDVAAHRVERLGAILLAETPLAEPDPDLVAGALLEGLRREGLSLLRWSAEATALRQRLAFCHRSLGAQWPDVGEEALVQRVEEWLGPELRSCRTRAALARVDAGTALRRLLPWPLAGSLDEVAPERVTVPSGSRIRVDYGEPESPVLAVRLQELFGWQQVPVIGVPGRATSIPLVVHLLSPAGRPVAVTRDLASFWRTGYPQVRSELRGRYPKHAWPQDPSTAEPTRRTRPRR